MTPNKLKKILTAHREWLLSGGEKGTRADLRGADLFGADLRGADLSSADLRGADLSSADLSSADLSSADLSSADLSSADLRGARQIGADLSSADLSSADLFGADLRGAAHVVDAGTPNGWRCVAWMDKGVLSVRVGFRNNTMPEARKYWADKSYRREVLAALDYVEAVAKLRAETDPYWRTTK